MSLKNKTISIEKACKEANAFFMKGREKKQLINTVIYSDEGHPVVERLCEKYQLNPSGMMKILNIKN